MKYVFEHDEIASCDDCPMFVFKQCSIMRQRIVKTGKLKDANLHAFVKPEGECPLRDFDVEKRLYLIKFLEGARDVLLRTEKHRRDIFNRKYLYKRAIDADSLDHIINGIKELIETERFCNKNKSCKLEAENAKLRELVSDMWHDIPKTESCGWDINTNICTGSDKCIGECSYQYRMRELGIEV